MANRHACSAQANCSISRQHTHKNEISLWDLRDWCLLLTHCRTQEQSDVKGTYGLGDGSVDKVLVNMRTGIHPSKCHVGTGLTSNSRPWKAETISHISELQVQLGDLACFSE